MALGKKPYPKATVKKIIKAHSNHNLKKNADVTVCLDGLMIAIDANVYLPQIFLNYVLFMENLVKEAAIQSKQSGERGLSARSVKKVTRDTLAKFKG
ncbi:histone-like transcription factor (CBF/NF-Y) and archaeal histone domain-containing protein [Fusarium austroafricanum]|uniref:Histone-like transcription factor (CBF/NF-Y) and archaeal histone domain-containing protein n=1 Tax=Fusarium austroafricanum TaxID=2364996 RepID=A0A8H4KDB3_9HYPO|nr:histone-like transcription factor (CBF/NF-Y) and archaeal histone domain-containing protein [Fusarium austroafricanum]